LNVESLNVEGLNVESLNLDRQPTGRMSPAWVAARVVLRLAQFGAAQSAFPSSVVLDAAFFNLILRF
jgi:hypothetical protein